MVFLDEEGEEMSIIGYGRGQNQTAVYIVQNPTGRPGRTVKAVDGLSEEKKYLQPERHGVGDLLCFDS